jgi:hypothetical protein
VQVTARGGRETKSRLHVGRPRYHRRLAVSPRVSGGAGPR